MAKKILTLRDVALAEMEHEEPVSAYVERPPAPSAYDERPPFFEEPLYEEPPSAYDRLTPPLPARPEGQHVVVAGVEMGFGRMVSVAMRWPLAYLLAIALFAAIGGVLFVAVMLVLRSVS